MSLLSFLLDFGDLLLKSNVKETRLIHVSCHWKSQIMVLEVVSGHIRGGEGEGREPG